MSEIRKCFTSRWGQQGCLIEADYSQLEIICLAFLCQDIQMYDDINCGRDMHTMRAALMYGIDESDVTPRQRRNAKQFSFQLQYGAGAKSMSESIGCPIKIAQKFIKDYYNRYPRVAEWQDMVAESFLNTRIPSSRITVSHKTAGKGWFTSITGRRYVMYEDDNPFYKPGQRAGFRKLEPATNFSPTKMKNYPVQGFATGDIVPMMLGELNNWMLSRSPDLTQCLLINTVHDSLVIDAKFDIGRKKDARPLKLFCFALQKRLQTAPALLKEKFGIDFDLPLKVDIKVGVDWGSMKEFDTDVIYNK